jgi:hypothetical protein
MTENDYFECYKLFCLYTFKLCIVLLFVCLFVCLFVFLCWFCLFLLFMLFMLFMLFADLFFPIAY